MPMLQTATILFAITALGGLLMAGIRFATHRNPPAWLAASGLTLLVYAICATPVPAHAKLGALLFLVAAGGGAVMSLAYKWRQRLLPAWLVIVHALLAVTGFLLLLLAAFGGGTSAY